MLKQVNLCHALSTASVLEGSLVPQYIEFQLTLANHCRELILS